MASYEGVLERKISGQSNPVTAMAIAPPQITGVTGPESPGDGPLCGTRVARGAKAPPLFSSRSGVIERGMGSEFFERIYVLPRSVDLGIVLATTITSIDVFNAYRLESRQWLSYDDSSAGDGVSITDLPSLPATLPRLGGDAYTLEVTTDGPPFVDGNLVFGFDGTPSSKSVPIVFQRSVVFPFQPEAPIVERLEWVTEIRESASGYETRAALRDAPRATWRYEVITEGHDRRYLQNLIADGQARAYGVPLWVKSSDLAADIAATDLTITVDSTTYRDFEVGGLAIVWSDSETYETLQVSSFTTTTITFASAFTQDFNAGALVMPVKAALLLKPVDQSRWRVSLQSDVFEFVVIDNDDDIADESAFSSYTPTGGVQRALLDDGNFVSGDQVREQWRRNIDIVDTVVGAPAVFSNQVMSREATRKGFITDTRQGLYEVRQLLHSLRGRHRSFYLPTFFPDLEVVTDITSADSAVAIKDVDYTNLVAQKTPRNVVRVVKSDGTKSDPKLVTGSSKPISGEESLSISPDTFGVNAAVADIDRVEFVQKSRLDSDRVELQHFNSSGKAVIGVPVVTVLEGDA